MSDKRKAIGCALRVLLATNCCILAAIGGYTYGAGRNLNQLNYEYREAYVESLDDIQTVYQTADGTLWAIAHTCFDQYESEFLGESVTLVYDRHDIHTGNDDEIVGVQPHGRDIMIPVTWDVDYDTYVLEGMAP